VREIFESDGEAAYRTLERAALIDALDRSEPSVVAAAGGVVLDPENRAALKRSGTVIWLRASPEVLASRVDGGQDHRPLLGGDAVGTLTRLDRERRALYEEVADHVIDIDDLDPEETAAAVLELVGEVRS